MINTTNKMLLITSRTFYSKLILRFVYILSRKTHRIHLAQSKLLGLIFLFTISSFFNNTLLAQLKTPGSSSNNGPNTYALIVGVSDYEDYRIEDLKFAHKDALAFATFLKDMDSGSSDSTSIVVLLNEEATFGKVMKSLVDLVKVAKEGDKIMIYFSGHGDKEDITLSEDGFLLCHDVNAELYLAGGALNITVLKNFISTLSTGKKAKVYLITDACRSGNLAGKTEGVKLVGGDLNDQFANEIKIMSCQADELSVEGTEWGGGRGVFSYFLTNGLYGKADRNKDNKVNLMEIRGYLEENVSQSAAPMSQFPVTFGKGNEVLANVNPEFLASLEDSLQNSIATLESIGSKGFGFDIDDFKDPDLSKIYELFVERLESKIFIKPQNDCAEFYYEQLKNDARLNDFISFINREYAAALIDESQQVLKLFLNTDMSEIQQSKHIKSIKYKHYPEYIEKAIELLGKEHFMHDQLNARKLFFEAYLIFLENQNPDEKRGNLALQKLNESLSYDSILPHVYLTMGKVYGYNFRNFEKAEEYMTKAAQLAPKWVLPYSDFAYLMSKYKKDYNRAKEVLDEAYQLDSTSILVNYSLANFHFMKKDDLSKARTAYEKTLSIDSTHISSYIGLGAVGMLQNDLDVAEKNFLKAIQLDPTRAVTYSNLGSLYERKNLYDLSIENFNKAIAVDSLYPNSYNNLAILYQRMKLYGKALKYYQKTLELDKYFNLAYKNLARLYLDMGHFDKAIEQYEKQISIDTTSSDSYLDLAIAYGYLGNSNAAIAEYKKAIKKDPGNKNAFLNFGIEYAMIGDFNNAKLNLLRALNIDPNMPDAKLNLGLIYMNQERFDKAETRFKEVLELDSTSVLAAYNLACIYSVQSDFTQAFNYLKQATDNGFADFNSLNNDLLLNNLRMDEARWNEFMKSLIPQQF